MDPASYWEICLINCFECVLTKLIKNEFQKLYSKKKLQYLYINIWSAQLPIYFFGRPLTKSQDLNQTNSVCHSQTQWALVQFNQQCVSFFLKESECACGFVSCLSKDVLLICINRNVRPHRTDVLYISRVRLHH